MSGKSCARCGRRLPADGLRVYSSFSHNYYCADIKACAKRARRRSRTQTVEVGA
jgi:hypothetical protein